MTYGLIVITDVKQAFSPIKFGKENVKKTSKSTGIKSWPEDDRPREKLLKKGASTLSNSELLAILLRTGTKGISAIDLGRKILSKFGTFKDMAHTDSRDWKEFNDEQKFPALLA